MQQLSSHTYERAQQDSLPVRGGQRRPPCPSGVRMLRSRACFPFEHLPFFSHLETSQSRGHGLSPLPPHFTINLPLLTAFVACVRQSVTASLQSSAALLDLAAVLYDPASVSMMHGGTASLHFFKHTLAGALPQRISYTLLAQHA